MPLEDARNVYIARTYAYVSGGKQGMVIVDVEQPEHPKLDQVFNADGADERHQRREDRHGATPASSRSSPTARTDFAVVQTHLAGDVPGISPASVRVPRRN